VKRIRKQEGKVNEGRLHVYLCLSLGRGQAQQGILGNKNKKAKKKLRHGATRARTFSSHTVKSPVQGNRGKNKAQKKPTRSPSHYSEDHVESKVSISATLFSIVERQFP